MIKAHIYDTKGHSYTVKDKAIEFTFLRQGSVTDGTMHIRPKGRQVVMIEVTEDEGKLIITNKATGQSVLI